VGVLGRLTGPIRNRPALAVAVLLACLAIATVPLGNFSAKAHVRTYRSNISINYKRSADGFIGRVRSFKECREGRAVQVFMQVPGPDTVVGSTTTDAHGRYGPVSALGPGFYYAKVAEVERGGYGHDHLCTGGTSRSLRVRA